ncbi:CRISPR-associated endonuclease Cas3'' [Ottowia testudinis]|uniref:CRISPR-associated endonuclease Cas3'' n=1 Tax=Ottowia testudinis TaxID=2816950 RepID=UPI00326794E5
MPDHLMAVGERAGLFASWFSAETMVRAAGLLHDVGKYTAEFQARLRGDPRRVDHSTWGAKLAVERFGPLGSLIAYAIAGHHAGLANGRGEGQRSPLYERIAAPLPELATQWARDIALPARLSVPPTFKPHSVDRGNFQLAFLARMVFSCLVDADFLDTEAFYRRANGDSPSARQHPMPDLQALRFRLDAHLAKFSADSGVNRVRADVLQHVRAQAGRDPGLFSLTVPTGGGKTLASLAFALDHAIAHGLRRVIFVIPFTSVVEQNAAVFRKALGDLGEAAVLEHHSAFVAEAPPRSDPDRYESVEKLRLAMENWDAPIVVTTAVQFFESLFAARTSQCRKLHNIAGSVVVIDEAQTMPLKLLRPCVAAVDELARNYRSTVVLCTATQPALESPKFDGGLVGVRELAPEPTQLFEQLARVCVRHIGSLSDEALEHEMRSRDRVLCIVNNRRHARAVYESMAGLPGARHLSTLMCAKHRSKVLGEVRQMLVGGEPCRLVSTSLIEAGVDVDFPTVLRAEAGLDSIAQAAGRCNREGKRAPADSDVIVFATDNEDWAPPPELKQYAQAAREVLRQVPDGDPLSPDAIRRYFELLYWQKGDQQLDAPNLLGLLKDSRIDSLPLETLASKFRMIDSAQVPVIVPYDDSARSLLRDLQFAEGCGGIARALQPYVVQVPQRAFDALYKAGAVSPVAPLKWGEQFMASNNDSIYHPEFGLSWSDPSFIPTDRLMW